MVETMIKIFAVFRMMGFTLPKKHSHNQYLGICAVFFTEISPFAGATPRLDHNMEMVLAPRSPYWGMHMSSSNQTWESEFPFNRSIYLFIYLSIHPSIHPSNLSIYLSIYLSIFYLSSIHPSIHPSFLPSFHLPVYLSLNNSCCTFTTCCT